ncbi:CDP-alcohol phosphatidyltransferase family protein [Microlunatus antarcticus]|uniref:Phosphatidylcholine synthase n=1 Tax=Microlunatus antarcticus TaxID=53388 RepID=A0A7W5JVN6_9ACTN|nr:CDP-alcohol phosphatidyltransferase family protein [Microlunatus antarcticus]MBB3327195.1 phosphatidylcholine synthase [Microlunatus antarcticus]
MLTLELPSRPTGSVRARVAGWALHVYTASGSVLALLAVLAAVDGRVDEALWVLLAALVVDGTDGMLARRLRVSETIPGFDGARLDDIVDYLTYVFAPVVLLLCTGRLPGGTWGLVLAALPLLASCIQFCRKDAKTEDHYFLGFPSYWNVVAFYAVVLDLSPAVVAVVLVTCSVLVFVPIKYLYPSRARRFRLLNLGLAGLWLVLYAVILAGMPDPSRVALVLSLAYLAYYLLASVLLTVLQRLRRVRLLAS